LEDKGGGIANPIQRSPYKGVGNKGHTKGQGGTGLRASVLKRGRRGVALEEELDKRRRAIRGVWWMLSVAPAAGYLHFVVKQLRPGLR